MLTGRLLFTQSSFTSPNDVFVIHNLKQFETEVLQSDNLVSFSGEIRQLTHLTGNALEGKHLSKGEEIWFKGANDRDVQGWILKPGGWKDNDYKKWPIVLLIHGGTFVLLVCGSDNIYYSHRSTGCLGGPMVHKMESQWLKIPVLLNTYYSLTSFLVFAQQGYCVVAINPTGSTTFGQGLFF